MREEANLYKKKTIGSETWADFQRPVTCTADGREFARHSKSSPGAPKFKESDGNQGLVTHPARSSHSLQPVYTCLWVWPERAENISWFSAKDWRETDTFPLSTAEENLPRSKETIGMKQRFFRW